MKGWEIYYNFITKHQQIKYCPYELAIPELAEKLKDVKNKWIALINFGVVSQVLTNPIFEREQTKENKE